MYSSKSPGTKIGLIAALGLYIPKCWHRLLYQICTGSTSPAMTSPTVGQQIHLIRILGSAPQVKKEIESLSKVGQAQLCNGRRSRALHNVKPRNLKGCWENIQLWLELRQRVTSRTLARTPFQLAKEPMVHTLTSRTLVTGVYIG